MDGPFLIRHIFLRQTAVAVIINWQGSKSSFLNGTEFSSSSKKSVELTSSVKINKIPGKLELSSFQVPKIGFTTL